ncbi:hypothetical protein [Defluviimonas sp. WL0075]|uniref:Aminoglycoside phosphotransferase domain-containing protein n=1 Tax=Albidovulum sediminicola TaxID=2984331 RepID=A0ABT2Z1P4_9RHOB|nr:hypothetical protein [Defluviimonas sp. WL0075]MCV2865065.1 hypothetical protein [Defluviimonas sp. WL0075]
MAKIAAALRDRGTPAEEVRETNMAWVFLTRDAVFKAKKPVRSALSDCRSLRARRDACNEELRLNRRLAPDVYLGLSRLTRLQGGSFAIDGDGATAEWLVHMRRLEAARFLDQAIRSGDATPGEIAAAADRLTRFHAGAARPPIGHFRYLGRYRHEIQELRHLLNEPPFQEFAPHLDRLAELLDQFLADDIGLILSRLDDGHVVDGHGDLRPEHVWLGPPVLIIDCLEGSADHRALDPYEEYATLAMECAALGARGVQEVLFERAAMVLGPVPPPRLIAFYTVFRATLRTRQALAHLLDPTPRTPEKWVPQAARYLALAEEAALSLEGG